MNLKAKIILIILVIVFLLSLKDLMILQIRLELRKHQAQKALTYNKLSGCDHFARCERCGMPCNRCQLGKGVWISEKKCVFPLCAWCEQEIPPQKQLKYYRKWFEQNGGSKEQWLTIEKTLMQR